MLRQSCPLSWLVIVTIIVLEPCVALKNVKSGDGWVGGWVSSRHSGLTPARMEGRNFRTRVTTAEGVERVWRRLGRCRVCYLVLETQRLSPSLVSHKRFSPACFWSLPLLLTPFVFLALPSLSLCVSLSLCLSVPFCLPPPSGLGGVSGPCQELHGQCVPAQTGRRPPGRSSSSIGRGWWRKACASELFVGAPPPPPRGPCLLTVVPRKGMP